MSFEKFYTTLNPKNGQRFLIFGEALPMALYLGGRAMKDKKVISLDALVESTAEYTNEQSAMASNKDTSKMMELGISRCSISHGDILAYHGALKVNGVIYNSDVIESAHFEKLSQIVQPGGRIILSLSKKYFNPLLLEEKSFFRKYSKMTSFREILIASGITIDYYGIENNRLLCVCRIRKFNRKYLKEQPPFIPLEDAGKNILNSYKSLIKSTVGDSQYAIREGEYLYYVEVQEEQGPYQYRVVFMDGEYYFEESSSGKGKHFNIYVLPNIRTFIEELELRDVLIVGRDRILELFGDHYASY
jgi:hypothetical protein